jgi:hypothetical protein
LMPVQGEAGVHENIEHVMNMPLRFGKRHVLMAR